jgi:hypothetical protein
VPQGAVAAKLILISTLFPTKLTLTSVYHMKTTAKNVNIDTNISPLISRHSKEYNSKYAFSGLLFKQKYSRLSHSVRFLQTFIVLRSFIQFWFTHIFN